MIRVLTIGKCEVGRCSACSDANVVGKETIYVKFPMKMSDDALSELGLFAVKLVGSEDEKKMTVE